MLLPKLKRVKDRRHLEYVASLPCCICQYSPVQAHHLLRVPTNERGMGMKTGDNWAIPLCSDHHSALHNNGDEVGFLASYGIDGVELAQELFGPVVT